MIEDLPGRYEDYLARAKSKLGALEAGAFVGLVLDPPG